MQIMTQQGIMTVESVSAAVRRLTRRNEHMYQAWRRDYWRAVRTLNRWYGEVERLQDAGVADDAPEMRRALYHRTLAQRSYERVTD